MAEGKRYYWLKLKDDFFSSKRIKKLRNMAGGDTYTIIYLKMQLLALKTEGVITWSGLEDNFAEELALDLDEKPNDVEMTLMFLLKTGLIETSDNQHFFLPYVLENTGSEGASAKRMRDFRERQSSQCGTLPSQCDKQVTQAKRLSDGEKEIEKESEIEVDTEEEKEKENNNNLSDISIPHDYPDYEPDPKRTCFRSDPDPEYSEKLHAWAKKIKSFIDKKWDPTGMYSLAKNDGVEREDIEAYLEEEARRQWD